MNPFKQVLETVPKEETPVTLPYLDKVRSIMESGNISLPLYADIITVLEFLSDAGALELRSEETGRFYIKRRT